jgi:hypothetical protein
MALCAAFLALLISCSGSSVNGRERAELGLAKAASPSGDLSFKLDTSGGSAGLMPEGPASAQSQLPVQAADQKLARKLIRTGSVSLESRDLAKAEEAIAGLAAAAGGYVSSSSNSGSSIYMTLRVPQEKFGLVMEGLKGAGRLKSRDESVQDVTLSYVDMESRIATKKILKERYTEYLRRAAGVSDLLAVEKSLNDVLSELDAMEASFKALRDQVDYATVSVGVELPPEARPAAERSFQAGLLRLWDGFQSFLFILAYVLVGLVLFGIPAIALLGLLYWLLLGKIGLLRKFFRLLSGKK